MLTMVCCMTAQTHFLFDYSEDSQVVCSSEDFLAVSSSEESVVSL